jgi:hypothetical protein
MKSTTSVVLALALAQLVASAQNAQTTDLVPYKRSDVVGLDEVDLPDAVIEARGFGLGGFKSMLSQCLGGVNSLVSGMHSAGGSLSLGSLSSHIGTLNDLCGQVSGYTNTASSSNSINTNQIVNMVQPFVNKVTDACQIMIPQIVNAGTKIQPQVVNNLQTNLQSVINVSQNNGVSTDQLKSMVDKLNSAPAIKSGGYTMGTTIGTTMGTTIANNLPVETGGGNPAPSGISSDPSTLGGLNVGSQEFCQKYCPSN